MLQHSLKSLYASIGGQFVGLAAILVVTSMDSAFLALGILQLLGVIMVAFGIAGAMKKSRVLLGIYGGLCFMFAVVCGIFITFSLGFLSLPTNVLVRESSNLKTFLVGRALANSAQYTASQVRALQITYPVIYGYAIVASAIAMLVAIIITGPDTVVSHKSDLVGRPSQRKLAPSLSVAESRDLYRESRPSFGMSRMGPSLYNNTSKRDRFADENFEEVRAPVTQSVLFRNEAAAVVAPPPVTQEQPVAQELPVEIDTETNKVPMSNGLSMYGGANAENEDKFSEVDSHASILANDREAWFSKYYEDEDVNKVVATNNSPLGESARLVDPSPKAVKSSLFDNLYKPASQDFSVGEQDRIQSIKPLNIVRDVDSPQPGSLRAVFLPPKASKLASEFRDSAKTNLSPMMNRKQITDSRDYPNF